MLLDLGLSSYQLEASRRGFTFQGDEPLDMRFDATQGPTAAELVNTLAGGGAGPHPLRARRGAARAAHRPPHRGGAGRRSLRTTGELVAAVKRGVPRAAWPRRTHVATRTFQALRMAVNDEVQAPADALPQAAALLGRGGRLGVISFHSGEDRIVKRTFRTLETDGFGELQPSPVSAAARGDGGESTGPERQAARAPASGGGVSAAVRAPARRPARLLAMSLGRARPGRGGAVPPRARPRPPARDGRGGGAGRGADDGVLGVVGLRAQQVRLSYRMDGLRTARAEAEELNRRLRGRARHPPLARPHRGQGARTSSAWWRRAGTRCSSRASSWPAAAA